MQASIFDNKTAIFSICATNYVGLAEVMLRSARTHHPGMELHLFVTDSVVISFPKLDNIVYHSAQAELIPYYKDLAYSDLAFAYDVTELATSIKAACFLFLFDSSLCHRAVYLDPDIYLYNNIDSIFNSLNSYSVTLTPHILSSSLSSKCPLPETFINTTGIFNLGFIGFSKTSTALEMLKWWHQRLLKYCLSETIDGQYTDQLWINFLFSYWDTRHIAILRSPGFNLAPWNYHERVVVDFGSCLNVLLKDPEHFPGNDLTYQNDKDVSYPLSFAHFSGFNYAALMHGVVEQKNIHHTRFKDSSVLPIYENYISALQSSQSRIEKFLRIPYAYALNADGFNITSFQRRLFYSSFINPVNQCSHQKMTPIDFQSAVKSKNAALGLIRGVFERKKKNIFGEDRTHVGIPLPIIIRSLFRLLYLFLGDNTFNTLLKGLRHLSRIKRYTYFIE